MKYCIGFKLKDSKQAISYITAVDKSIFTDRQDAIAMAKREASYEENEGYEFFIIGLMD